MALPWHLFGIPDALGMSNDKWQIPPSIFFILISIVKLVTHKSGTRGLTDRMESISI